MLGQDTESNPYRLDSPLLFDRLSELVGRGSLYAQMLRSTGKNPASKDRRPLLEWVMSKTSALDGSYSLATRCFWILHGLTEFPRCRNFDECGNTLEGLDVRSVTAGYGTGCCCRACAEKLRARHVRETLLARYGADNAFRLGWVKEKCRLAHLANLGVDNPSRSETVKRKKEETCMRNYGVSYPLQSGEVMVKFKDTCLSAYGTDRPMDSPDVRQRWADSIAEKYGVSCSWLDPETQARRRDTMLGRYGVEWPIQSAELKEKAKMFYRERFGVDSNMQVPEICCRARRRYSYDGRGFDSAPEVAFYVWLRDSSADFEYQPDDFFEYEFDGRTRRYFPDFKILRNGGPARFVEVKGSQFLNGDGTWKNPYRDPEWTDERYAAECARYEAKRQCCLRNGVEIMYEAEYLKYVDYVRDRYGRGFLEGLRNG